MLKFGSGAFLPNGDLPFLSPDLGVVGFESLLGLRLFPGENLVLSNCWPPETGLCLLVGCSLALAFASLLATLPIAPGSGLCLLAGRSLFSSSLALVIRNGLPSNFVLPSNFNAALNDSLRSELVCAKRTYNTAIQS